MQKPFLAAVFCVAAGMASAGTLEDVKSRGTLQCGVNVGLVGFASQTGANGEWTGFDVSICRALAAAVLGDASAVSFTETTARTRFPELLAENVDLLSRNTTWSFSADVAEQVDFAGVNYYDGQGFMVPKSLGVSSAKELSGKSVCVQSETTSEANLVEYFQRNNIEYTMVPAETTADAQQLYLEGACEVYTTDASGLAAIRATFANPGEHALLPEIISKEPLGPVVRHGDNAWADVVRWTLNALIVAEELGVTSANIDELRESSTNPEIKRLLGVEGGFGAAIGLDPDWAVRAIKAGGNYGEIFAKTIGENTAIGLSRGLNAQWTDGGLLYSLPFR